MREIASSLHRSERYCYYAAQLVHEAPDLYAKFSAGTIRLRRAIDTLHLRQAIEWVRQMRGPR